MARRKRTTAPPPLFELPELGLLKRILDNELARLGTTPCEQHTRGRLNAILGKVESMQRAGWENLTGKTAGGAT